MVSPRFEQQFQQFDVIDKRLDDIQEKLDVYKLRVTHLNNMYLNCINNRDVSVGEEYVLKSQLEFTHQEHRRVLDDLEKKLNDSRKKNQSLITKGISDDKKRKNNEEKISRQLDKIKEQKLNIDSLNDENKKHNQELQDVMKKLDENDITIKQMSTELDRCKTESESIKLSYSNTQEQIRILQIQNEALDLTQRKYDKNVEDQKIKYTDLYNKYKLELDNCNDEKKRLAIKNENISAQIGLLQEKVKKTIPYNENLTKQINDLTKEKSDIESKVYIKENAIKELTLKLESLSATTEQNNLIMQQKIQENENQVKQISLELEKCKKEQSENGRSSSSRSETQDQVSALQADIVTLTNDNLILKQTLEKRIEEYNTIYSKYKSDIDTWTDEKSVLLSDVNDKTTQIDVLTQRNADMKQSNINIVKKINELKKDKESIDSYNRALYTQTDNMNKTLNDYISKQDELDKKYDLLRVNNDRMINENTKKLEELQRQLQRCNQSIEQTNKKNTVLENERKKLEETNNTLTEQLREQKKYILTLENELGTIQVTEKYRNIYLFTLDDAKLRQIIDQLKEIQERTTGKKYYANFTSDYMNQVRGTHTHILNSVTKLKNKFMEYIDKNYKLFDAYANGSTFAESNNTTRNNILKTINSDKTAASLLENHYKRAKSRINTLFKKIPIDDYTTDKTKNAKFNDLRRQVDKYIKEEMIDNVITELKNVSNLYTTDFKNVQIYIEKNIQQDNCPLDNNTYKEQRKMIKKMIIDWLQYVADISMLKRTKFTIDEYVNQKILPVLVGYKKYYDKNCLKTTIRQSSSSSSSSSSSIKNPHTISDWRQFDNLDLRRQFEMINQYKNYLDNTLLDYGQILGLSDSTKKELDIMKKELDDSFVNYNAYYNNNRQSTEERRNSNISYKSILESFEEKYNMVYNTMLNEKVTSTGFFSTLFG